MLLNGIRSTYQSIIVCLCLVPIVPATQASTEIELDQANIKRNHFLDKINTSFKKKKSQLQKLQSTSLSAPSNNTAKILSDSLVQSLNFSDDDALQNDNATFGKQAIYHRYQQTYKGIPVENSYIVVKSDKASNVTQLSGKYFLDLHDDLPQVTLPVRIDTEELKQWISANYFEQQDSTRWVIERFNVKPVILTSEKNKPALVYKISFFASNDNASPIRPVVYYDFHRKEIVKSYNRLTHYRAAGSGDGGNDKIETMFYSSMNDIPDSGKLDTFVIDRYLYFSKWYCDMDSDNVKTIDYENNTSNGPDDAYTYRCANNNSFEENTSSDSVLNDAHYHAQITNRMYEDYLDFKPLGNKTIKQRVHYGNSFNNAFWDGEYVTYGDGGSIVYPMVVLDVVAHEITHGYIEQHVDLGIQGHAGAINESLADIAGEAAEYFLDPSKQNKWEHNYDALIAAGAARYLKRPSDDGKSIDTALHYTTNMNPHYASGVFNRAFYMLVNPDNLYTQNVSWTLPNAFKVFTMAVKQCFYPSITFTQAAQCVLSQADEVAPDYESLCSTNPTGNSCKQATYKIQNDIKKAFAIVDVDVDVEGTYQVDTIAQFRYEQNLLNTSFTDTTYSPSGIKEINWDFGDGNTGISTGSGTVINHSYSQSGRYWVTMTVTNNNNHTDTYVKEVYVNSNYCSATGQSSSKRWISNVSVNSKPNNSTKEGYGDYSGTVFTGTSASQASISLTPDYDAGQDAAQVYWVVWIDSDSDGTFSESERVFEAQGYNTVTGQFTVPSLAQNTLARMRVIMRWIGSPNSACGNIGTGEVEDYSFKVSDTANDYFLSFDHAPSSLTVNFSNKSVAPRGTTWHWDFGDNNTSDQESPSYTYSSNGTYTVTLNATLPDGETLEPQTQSVTVEETVPGVYCEASSTETTWELIQRVQVSNVDNDSGSSSVGYEHYTDEAISLFGGQTHDFVFVPWYRDGEAVQKYWRAWIDYDGDQLFESNEEIFNQRISTNRLEGSFTVPQSGASNTRMRVIMRHLDTPDACGSFGGTLDGGEVEDYDVSISY